MRRLPHLDGDCLARFAARAKKQVTDIGILIPQRDIKGRLAALKALVGVGPIGQQQANDLDAR